MFREGLDLHQRTVIALLDLAEYPELVTAPEGHTRVVDVDSAKPRARPHMTTHNIVSHDVGHGLLHNVSGSKVFFKFFKHYCL